MNGEKRIMRTSVPTFCLNQVNSTKGLILGGSFFKAALKLLYWEECILFDLFHWYQSFRQFIFFIFIFHNTLMFDFLFYPIPVYALWILTSALIKRQINANSKLYLESQLCHIVTWDHQYHSDQFSTRTANQGPSQPNTSRWLFSLCLSIHTFLYLFIYWFGKSLRLHNAM